MRGIERTLRWPPSPKFDHPPAVHRAFASGTCPSSSRRIGWGRGPPRVVERPGFRGRVRLRRPDRPRRRDGHPVRRLVSPGRPRQISARSSAMALTATWRGPERHFAGVISRLHCTDECGAAAGADASRRRPEQRDNFGSRASSASGRKFAGSKEQAIREIFDLNPTRYYQIPNGLDSPAALAADPCSSAASPAPVRRQRAAQKRLSVSVAGTCGSDPSVRSRTVAASPPVGLSSPVGGPCCFRADDPGPRRCMRRTADRSFVADRPVRLSSAAFSGCGSSAPGRPPRGERPTWRGTTT